MTHTFLYVHVHIEISLVNRESSDAHQSNDQWATWVPSYVTDLACTGSHSSGHVPSDGSPVSGMVRGALSPYGRVVKKLRTGLKFPKRADLRTGLEALDPATVWKRGGPRADRPETGPPGDRCIDHGAQNEWRQWTGRTYLIVFNYI